VATRIEHVSGEPLGIAGLWSSWKNPKNGRVHSFTMLTINADTHPLMKQFHKPTDEKRMVVILPPQHYQGWLDDERAVVDYMVPMDADQLQAVVPVPNPPPVQAPLL
jgi:putative SOS response-associated peptidase YedK